MRPLNRRSKPGRAAAWRWLSILALAAATVVSGRGRALGQGQALGGSPPSASPRAAPMDRLIGCFDFEEAEDALVEFPRFFKRNLAEDRGFPRFGRMGLARDAAATGNWSFRFGLDGGSLAAETPTGVLPILPLADYVVTAQVRTEGLTHARARIVAWLYDAAGKPIPESRRASPPILGRGGWETVTVHVPGNQPDAVDLVVELQLLQPSQLSIAEPVTGEPRFEDVAGTAWFDDVCIWHLPRIELAIDAPGNLVSLPAPPRISVHIRDVAGEALTAQLRIDDLSGAPVSESTFPAPRGRQPLLLDLPITRSGWYRAELKVWSPKRLAGRSTLDFVVLPETALPRSGRNGSLAVHLPFEEPERMEMMPPLVSALSVGEAILPIWSERLALEDAPARTAALRRTSERLLRDGIDVSFALDGVPRELAGTVGIDPDQVLEFIGRQPDAWRPHLEEILGGFGLRVRRWQLGNTGRPDAFWKSDLDELVRDAGSALSEFVPDPSIMIPFSADQEMPATNHAAGVVVTVPRAVAPETLPVLAAKWLADGRDVLAHLEVLPADAYAPRQQVVDLLLRGLYGWRSGLTRMSISAPWRWEGEERPAPIPEPAFAAWRGLARALANRRFAGELGLADGVHCWLMEGDSPDRHALVAWRDQRESDEPTEVELVLADHAVRIVDAFGNPRRLEPENGVHRIPIGDMPLFVEEIDLPLARFRTGISIEPAFLPAMHRVHEAELVIRNPWDVGISGSIRLRDTDDIQLSPRRREFLLRAREELRLPLSIIVDRSIIAGTKRIEADVRLRAEQEFRLRVHTTITVGWSDVDMTASWGVSRNAETGELELVITQSVTNRGNKVIYLDAFLLGKGLGQNRRVIGALQPGVTAVRTYRLPGDVRRLSRQRLRVGVAERSGLAQLNQVVQIPDLGGFGGTARSAGAPADSGHR